MKSGLDALSIISATVIYVLSDHSKHTSIQIFSEGYIMLHRNMSSSVTRNEFHRSGHTPRHHSIFHLDPSGLMNVGSIGILCRGFYYCSQFKLFVVDSTTALNFYFLYTYYVTYMSYILSSPRRLLGPLPTRAVYLFALQ